MAFSENSGIGSAQNPNVPYTSLGLSGRKIRILLVDDHLAYREGLRAILELEPDMEVVGEAGTGATALEQMGALKPDIVLMDLSMPGMGGVSTTRRLADEYPGILVIVLTMFEDEENLREARRAGASAYILKDAGGAILIQTIREVMSGETPILQREDQVITGPTLSVPPSDETAEPDELAQSDARLPITSNERAVLKYLAAGLANDRIAAQTGLSESMVRTYLEEIYRKLGLPGRDAAARFARQHGLADEM